MNVTCKCGYVSRQDKQKDFCETTDTLRVFPLHPLIPAGSLLRVWEILVANRDLYIATCEFIYLILHDETKIRCNEELYREIA